MDIHTTLLVASAQLQNAALLAKRNANTNFVEHNVDFPYMDDDDIFEAAGLDADLLQRLSRDSVLLAAVIHDQDIQRGPYDQIEKCTEYFEKSLQWPEREFRHEYRYEIPVIVAIKHSFVRMSRETFNKTVRLLEKNPIFTSTGRRPQRAVRYQLATFLMRYGQRGSGVMAVSKKMGIGYGTVFLYCWRVGRALRELGVEVIVWGDDARKTATATRFENLSGLRHCVGIIDGSLIRLAEIPDTWGVTYFCRKKFPAVSLL